MQFQILMLLFLAASIQTLLASDTSGPPLCRTSKQLLGGVHILDATECSTNRALGYAIGKVAACSEILIVQCAKDEAASNLLLLPTGKEFRDSIAARLAVLGPKLDKTVEFAKSEDGSQAIASLTKASQDAYPQYWEELEGIAEGSGVPKELIVLLNFRQEVATLLAGNGSRVDDCSDVLLRLPGDDGGLALLGHNEDNTADTVNSTFFVQAKLNGRAWTAYTYAGELSSAAWGFSDVGVSFTLNAVFPTSVEVTGVGRNFVSRSILDAPSLDAAVAAITVDNQATGHNINVLHLDSLRILSIETGPGNASNVKEVSNGSYFHANSYLRLDVPQIAGASTRHREARAAEIGAPQSREDILAILGDTEDKEYPIYRTGSGPDDIYTLCTAFFDLHAETVEVFFSNPKESQDLSSVRGLRASLRTSAEGVAMIESLDGKEEVGKAGLQTFRSAAWVVGIVVVVIGGAGVVLASYSGREGLGKRAPFLQQELLPRPGLAPQAQLAEKELSHRRAEWLLEPSAWPTARL